MILLQIFESVKIGMIISKLGWIDLFIVFFILWGAILGFTRGLKDQIPRFITICVVIITAMHFYKPIAALVVENSSIIPVLSETVTFFLLSFGAYIVSSLTLLAIGKLGTVEFVYFLERIVGGCLGALRLFFLACLLLFFVNLLSLPIITIACNESSLSGTFALKVPQYMHDCSTKFLRMFKKAKESVA